MYAAEYAAAVDITITIAALLLLLLYYILAALHYEAFRHMLRGMPNKLPIEKDVRLSRLECNYSSNCVDTSCRCWRSSRP